MTDTLDIDKLTKLRGFLKGNPEAFQLALDLLYIAHFADDLYDQDVERTREDIKTGFRKLLVDVPTNPFYMRFYPQLSTLIAEAYMMWSDSTAFERGDEAERFICFHIRNQTLMIIHHMILLTGGIDWAEEQGPAYWREFAPNQDKLTELLQE